MAKRLAANVILLGPDGTPSAFLEGTPKTEVPSWAQEQITNPAVWDGEDEPKADKPEAEQAKADEPKPVTRKRTSAK